MLTLDEVEADGLLLSNLLQFEENKVCRCRRPLFYPAGYEKDLCLWNKQHAAHFLVRSLVNHLTE